MSFTDRLVLWLHVGFVIFAIGPVTIAAMSTPRYIRKGNIPVVRYLSRMTRIFAALSMGVLLFGLILAQLKSDFSHPWLTASMTLFVVAAVLLLLVMRDQRRALAALDVANARAAGAVSGGAGASDADLAAGPAEEPAATAADSAAVAAKAPEAMSARAAVETAPRPDVTAVTGAEHVATVERGRIASLAGVVSLIWLVILILMVWNG